jgi:predicted MFS family arabinose efflux permease/quinol monooxygenase YgiN
MVGLSVCTLSGHMSPGFLLAFTFGVGIGEALAAPPFQAIVSDLVPKSLLISAVSLNSVGFNLARAVGPAIGGLVVARFGPGANFLVDTLSFSAVLIVLHRWREASRHAVLPAERFTGAMHAGLRYLHYSPELRNVLVRTGVFVISASALWALLPLLIKELKLGPAAFGILLGCLGVGALAGGSLLPWLRKHFSLDLMIAGSTVLFGVATLTSGLLQLLTPLVFLMLLAGMGWIVLISSLNVATRAVVPAWVQARALAIYLLVFQGGMALGSFGWGLLASHIGTRATLAAAGASLLLTLPLSASFSLKGGQALNLNMAPEWEMPIPAFGIPKDTEPVLVTIRYRITQEHLQEFRSELRRLEMVRRRDGALQWGLFADTKIPGTYIEEFVVESWLDHERQHERVTITDQQLHDRIWDLHQGPEPPLITHYVAEGGRGS